MRPAVTAIAEAGLAVGLYSIPDVSGLPMTADAAAQLVAGPGGERIVAIKVTEANYETSTLRFLQDPRLARLKIVQGWDPHLARALREGPQHDAHGPAALRRHERADVVCRVSVPAYSGGGGARRLGRSRRGSSRRDEPVSAMQDDPAKFADLQRAKYIMGLGHPLTGTVTPQQFDRVLIALAQLAASGGSRPPRPQP